MPPADAVSIYIVMQERRWVLGVLGRVLGIRSLGMVLRLLSWGAGYQSL